MSPIAQNPARTVAWRSASLAVLAVLAALALAACGGGDSDPEQTAAAPDPAVEATSDEATTADEPDTDTSSSSENAGRRVTVALAGETFSFAGDDVTVCEADSGAATVEASSEGGSVVISHEPGDGSIDLTWDGATYTSAGTPDDVLPYRSSASPDMLTAQGSVVDGSGNVSDIRLNVICLELDEE